MATQTHWLLVDDLDGSRASTTVEFGLDGTSYAIDLSAENAARLRGVVAEFIGARSSRPCSTSCGGSAPPCTSTAAPPPAATAGGESPAPAACLLPHALRDVAGAGQGQA